MNDYTVRWEIEIDADSPEETARKALAIMRDPESTATYFQVLSGRYSQFLEEVDLG